MPSKVLPTNAKVAVSAKELNLDTSFLNGLRGFAALYVVIGHARWLLWEGYTFGYTLHPEKYSTWEKMQMYGFSFFKFGHQFVLFFFVLSGFVIYLSSYNLVSDKKNNSIGSFFRKRFRRIYPVFILSLVVTFILDFLGKNLNPEYYLGMTGYPNIDAGISSNLGLDTLIGNILFLMNNHFQQWGTNGPVWSLKYEVWFYIFFPLLIFIDKLFKKDVLYIVLIILYGLGLLYEKHSGVPSNESFIILDILFNIATWWSGVVLAKAFIKRDDARIKAISYALFLLPLGFYVNDDLIVSLGFTGFIASLIIYSEKLKRLRTTLTRMGFLGDFSYTLYIVHFPILVFLSATLVKYEGKLPMNHYYVVSGIIVAIVFSIMLFNLVEKRLIGTKRDNS